METDRQTDFKSIHMNLQNKNISISFLQQNSYLRVLNSLVPTQGALLREHAVKLIQRMFHLGVGLCMCLTNARSQGGNVTHCIIR